MRFALTLVTTAALLLHLTCGCGWWHAHADCRSTAFAPAVDEHDCDHNHDAPVPVPQEPLDSCDELECSFLTAAKTMVDASSTSERGSADANFLAIVSPATSHCSARNYFAASSAPRPLRAHFLHQIMLI